MKNIMDNKIVRYLAIVAAIAIVAVIPLVAPPNINSQLATVAVIGVALLGRLLEGDVQVERLLRGGDRVQSVVAVVRIDAALAEPIGIGGESASRRNSTARSPRPNCDCK